MYHDNVKLFKPVKCPLKWKMKSGAVLLMIKQQELLIECVALLSFSELYSKFQPSIQQHVANVHLCLTINIFFCNKGFKNTRQQLASESESQVRRKTATRNLKDLKYVTLFSRWWGKKLLITFISEQFTQKSNEVLKKKSPKYPQTLL